MNYYETLLIINPNLSEEDVENLSQKIRKGFEDFGASIIQAENWGKRRLTYEVKKSKKGYYLVYDCSIDSSDYAKKVDGLLRYNEDVLKYMTVRLRGEEDISHAMRENRMPFDTGEGGSYRETSTEEVTD